MKIIHRYIGKTIVSTTALVVFVLLGMEAFIEITHEFPDIGTGYYGLVQVFAYVPMILPLDIYQLFPMAGLLGSIIGLGLLATHSELIVMRASGISITEITWAVIKAAIFLTIIMLVIGELAAPLLQQKADINKTEALSGGQTLLTRQGVWSKDRNNFIHINKISSYGHLEGITRYNIDENSGKLKLISIAQSADYKDNQWTFNNVEQTNFDDTNISIEKMNTQQWDMRLKPRFLGVTEMESDKRSLRELARDIRYTKQSGLNATAPEFKFWQRIFQPLATIVMIILAIPFVFGPLRTVSMGLRMLAGTVMGFGFYILNQFVGPVATVYQIPPLIAALLPTLLFATLGWILLKKMH